MTTRNQQPGGRCHLVLAGGGHSHLAVLKKLGKQPPPNARITVISRRSTMLYTGMIPGLIAGHYGYHDCAIDLAALSRYAGAEFIQSELTSLQADNQTIELDDGQRIAYDLLSINTGGVTSLPDSADTHLPVMPVKPVEQLLTGIEQLEQSVQHGSSTMMITIIGGGAGSIELLLALHFRLNQSAPSCPLQWQLITNENDILTDHNPHVRRKIKSLLASRKIRLITSEQANACHDSDIITHTGNCYSSDYVIWSTGVQPPSWISQSGLAVDAHGFINTDNCLRSTSHYNIFAAGDVAGSLTAPLPKAGVFAVRQGRTLADNLQRQLSGDQLITHRSSSKALALISTGEKHAIASRGRLYLVGKWLWLLKDQIDRRFVRRYNHLI